MLKFQQIAAIGLALGSMSLANAVDRHRYEDKDLMKNQQQQEMSNWSAFGQVLCWTADQSGTDWAIHVKDPQANYFGYRRIPYTYYLVTEFPATNLDFKGPYTIDKQVANFDWSWGFKTGVKYANKQDGMKWDSSFKYTWLKTRSNQNIKANGTDNDFITVSTIENLNAGLGNTQGFGYGSMDWNIFLSMFDWEAGYSNNFNDYLTVRPYIGLKGGWIKQDMEKNFTGGFAVSPSVVDGVPFSQNAAWMRGNGNAVSFKLVQTNDFYGAGLSAGSDLLWKFNTPNTPHLLGRIGAALLSGAVWVKQEVGGDFAQLLQHFDFAWTLDGTYLNEVQTTDSNQKTLIRGLFPMLEMLLGLGWDTKFGDGYYGINIEISYEMQYFLDQNNFYIESSSSNYSNNLSFQGGNFSVAFDF